MVTLNWCLQQKNGIQLIEPNNNLSKAYFLDADDSLLAVERNKGKWAVVTSYYACYNALYALLVKVGIKSEIHDCTLVLMSLLGFTAEEITFMKKLKQDRIDVQYYLRSVAEPEALKIKSFVVKCKMLAAVFDLDKITKIRGLVKNG